VSIQTDGGAYVRRMRGVSIENVRKWLAVATQRRPMDTHTAEVLDLWASYDELCEVADKLWDEMLPYDYPAWASLGRLLGKDMPGD